MKATTATSVEAANGPVNRRNRTDATVTDVKLPKATTSEKLRRTPQRKYRHVAAVHFQTRPSCLSHDSQASPSFLGFRNLMVIVLGM